eukprot:139065_1
MDLRALVKTVAILNADKASSTISATQLINNQEFDDKSFIVSCDDEELLILVEFADYINLKSVKLYSLQNPVSEIDTSSPKQVHIYKISNLHLNFDDINAIKPDVSIHCTKTKLENKGQNIKLQKQSKNAIKFKQIKYMCIYIKSNQNDTELTHINSIIFKGHVDSEQCKTYNNNKSNYSKILSVNDTKNEFIPDLTCDIETMVNSSIYSKNLISVSHNIESKDGCELLTCLSFKVICNVLQLYHKQNNKFNSSNEEEKMADNNLDNILETFDNVDILNAFNHLLMAHVYQFEDIYNQLQSSIYGNKSCILSKCVLMRRNQRDRAKISDQRLNELYSSDIYNDIVWQQLLDRIHCYYFHSFDTGYKFTIDEKDRIINHEVKTNDDGGDMNILQINEIIKSKQKRHRDVADFHRLNNKNNKFTTDKLKQYDFGFKFYYWNHVHSKNNHSEWNKQVKYADWYEEVGGNWYIQAKYKHIKQELLQNEIYVIPQAILNQLITKADIHSNSQYAKQIFCPRNRSAVCYDMQYRKQISTDHILSLMVYCNNDVLQRKFTETFRKLKHNQTNKDFKNNHRNYYWMGRLLRECVECFGTTYCMDKTADIIVYHGINEQFAFPSLDFCVKGPFSTSTQYAVAVNFSGAKGMILEMTVNATEWALSCESTQTMQRAAYMDMKWISDFVNEEEIFSLGGLNKIQLTNIIEISQSKNYMMYIKALQMLSLATFIDKNDTGHWRPPAFGQYEKQLKQMVFRLLSHELNKCIPDHPDGHEWKTSPKYIRDLLHSHCMNVSQIRIMKENQDVLHYLFKNKTNHWIKLDVITSLFPNIQSIYYHAIHKDFEWLTQSSIYDSVLKFIQILRKTNRKSSLKCVSIACNPAYQDEIQNYLTRYQQNFESNSWQICTELTTRDTGEHDKNFGNPTNLMKEINSSFNPLMLEQMLQKPQAKEFMHKYGVDKSFIRNIFDGNISVLFIKMRKRIVQ